MKKVLSALLAMLMVSAAATAHGADFNAAWGEAAERYKERADQQGVVGSSLYILQNGEILGHEHYGFADLDTQRPVDADTIFHWASITKTLTVVAAMQLVERGLLSLDDPVARYLPEVRKVHNSYGSMDEITLRHLITHTSGFRGSTFPWGGSKDWHPHEPTEWAQVAAMMPYTEIEFEPGSRFSYSNPGLSMLGRVVEEVTGDSIETYLTKNILMPLGMTRSYFDVTPYYLLADRSNNYARTDDQVTAQGLDFDTGATVGNGGLNGPVSDMVKWLNFWLGVGDEGTYDFVLSRDTLGQMWRPIYPTSDPTVDEQMGMGFFVIDHASRYDGQTHRYIGHTGSQKSFTAFVYVEPKSKAAAIFTNNTTTKGVSREDSILRATRKDLFETVLPLLGR